MQSKRAKKRAAKWRLAGMIKTHTGCADCGYAASPYALQFDHLGDKKANVSDLIRSDYAWETIKEEILKCEVVCANCHAIRTKKRGQHHRTTSYPVSVEIDLQFYALMLYSQEAVVGSDL